MELDLTLKKPRAKLLRPMRFIWQHIYDKAVALGLSRSYSALKSQVCDFCLFCISIIFQCDREGAKVRELAP
jgi:hypothetical protein